MTASSILLAVGLSLPALAQPVGRTMSIGVGAEGHIGLLFETRVEPPAPSIDGLRQGLLATDAGQRTHHRWMYDPARRLYFGYDVTIDFLADANAYRVAISPLTRAPQLLELQFHFDKQRSGVKEDPAGWRMLPLPGTPPPQTVRLGQTIALDLFQNKASGQKIVDYVRILDRGREASSVVGTARDFSVDDAEIRIAQPRVLINGAPTTVSVNAVEGSTVWMYLPGHGRYVFSIAPHSKLGFVKAGEIRGDSLEFTIGGERITLACNERIVPGATPYNLYVLRDANWRPLDADKGQPILTGSAGKAEDLLRR